MYDLLITRGTYRFKNFNHNINKKAGLGRSEDVIAFNGKFIAMADVTGKQSICL